MNRLLLAGGGQAHALVLREIARRRAGGTLGKIEIAVVTPTNLLRYSGMLPGWIAGHYTLDELTVDLAPLAQAADARVVAAHVRNVDLAKRVAVLDSGEAIEFDVLSIATGAIVDVDAIAGAYEHALALRPFEYFVAGWQRIVQRAEAAGEAFRLVVIGGGAGGVETALAAAYRGRTLRSALEVQLITGAIPILPGHGDRARSLISAALLSGGVQMIDATALRVEPRAVITADRALTADATLIVTGAAAAPWLRDSGLALDSRGFVAVDSYLRSRSHPFVFAAGDAATLIETPRPKSGVYAVRAAPALANNLLAAIAGQPLSAFNPQQRALYLLTTGPKHAVASWGTSAVAGRWVWHWKNWIDRDYIAKLRHPPEPS